MKYVQTNAAVPDDQAGAAHNNDREHDSASNDQPLRADKFKLGWRCRLYGMHRYQFSKPAPHEIIPKKLCGARPPLTGGVDNANDLIIRPSVGLRVDVWFSETVAVVNNRFP